MTKNPNDINPANTADAILEMAKVLTQIGHKLAVMELAVLEGIERLPSASKRKFAEGFRIKAEEMMQRHSETLTPGDDAALSNLVAKFLAFARET